MGLIVNLFEALRRTSLLAASLWITALNIAIFFAALVIGEWLLRRYGDRRVSEPPPPVTRLEYLLAASCVALNSLVTIAGWVLWRADIIRVSYEVGWRVLVDALVLFFAMDFAMYVLHRVAHLPILYPLIHQTHHNYENPRPLTLFVLNPFETVSFGVLWLILISVYSSSLLGIAIYLTLNLAFGLVGHLGVEPLPRRWLELPGVRLISTSTFHAEHHEDRHHNYGFYTLIWDRLFGTLSPEYKTDFTAATSGGQ